MTQIKGGAGGQAGLDPHSHLCCSSTHSSQSLAELLEATQLHKGHTQVSKYAYSLFQVLKHLKAFAPKDGGLLSTLNPVLFPLKEWSLGSGRGCGVTTHSSLLPKDTLGVQGHDRGHGAMQVGVATPVGHRAQLLQEAFWGFCYRICPVQPPSGLCCP